MSQFGNEIFKEQRKSLIKIFSKLPKWVVWVLFGISIVVSFYGGIKFDRIYLRFNYNSPTQSGETNINVNNQVKGISTINLNNQNNFCPVKFCSDFKDGLWQYENRFMKIQDDPLILKSPHTSALPGATMFYSEDVGNFSSEVYITPEATTSANLVVAWGHFIRCIIGDGDYSNVSCQINEVYPREIESWSYIDKNGQLHGKHEQHQLSLFAPDKELQIQFGIEKSNNTNVITIKLNDQVPLEWQIPKTYEGRTQKEKVGVGLFTTNSDDVQAVFKQFQLDPHL